MLCWFLLFSLLLFSFPTGGWPFVCLSVRVGSRINLSYLSIDLSFSLSVHLWASRHHTEAQKCLKAHQGLTNTALWSQFFFKGIFEPEPLLSAHVLGRHSPWSNLLVKKVLAHTHSCQKKQVFPGDKKEGKASDKLKNASANNKAAVIYCSFSILLGKIHINVRTYFDWSSLKPVAYSCHTAFLAHAAPETQVGRTELQSGLMDR